MAARDRVWRSPRGAYVGVIGLGQSGLGDFGVSPNAPFYTSSPTNALHSYQYRRSAGFGGGVFADSSGLVALAPIPVEVPLGGTPSVHNPPTLAICRSFELVGQAAHVLAWNLQGGTPIADFLPGTQNFDDLVARIDASIASLRASTGSFPDSLLFIWNQGEQDAKDGTSGATYKTHLETIFAAISLRYARYEIRFVIWGLNSGAGEGGTPYAGSPTIRTAQSEFAASWGAYFLDTERWKITAQDGVHWPTYITPGQALQVRNAVYPELPYVVARTHDTNAAPAFWSSQQGGANAVTVLGGTTATTIEVILRKLTSGSSFANEHRLTHRLNTGTPAGLSLRIGTGTTVTFQLGDGGAVLRSATAAADLSDQKIHVLHATFNGSAAAIYLDGAALSVTGGAITGVTAAAASETLIVGQHVSGSVDELGIYAISGRENLVLDASAIAARWAAIKSAHTYEVSSPSYSWNAGDAGCGVSGHPTPAFWIGRSPHQQMVCGNGPDVVLEVPEYAP